MKRQPRGVIFSLYASPSNNRWARKEARRRHVKIAVVWNEAMDAYRGANERSNGDEPAVQECAPVAATG